MKFLNPDKHLKCIEIKNASKFKISFKISSLSTHVKENWGFLLHYSPIVSMLEWLLYFIIFFYILLLNKAKILGECKNLNDTQYNLPTYDKNNDIKNSKN